MPIPVYDAVGGNTANVASSLSWTHTPSGTPAAVVVWVAFRTDTTNNRTVSSCTYNGVAMSSITSISRDSATNRLKLFGYYLASPAAGAQTVTVTFSGGVAVPNGISVTYTSVDTGTPIGTPVTNNAGNTNTISVSPSADADDLAVGAFAYWTSNNTTHTQTPGGSAVERRDASITQSTVEHSDAATIELTGAGGATALSTSVSASHLLVLAIGVALQPGSAGGGGNPGRALTLTGVG